MNQEKNKFPSEIWSSFTGSVGVLHVRYSDIAGEDRVKELEKVFKELKRVENMLVQLDAKLQNQQFLDRAPENVVQIERQKRDNFKAQFNTLQKTYYDLSLFVEGKG
jgi:valyl-tRNA synthetase